jgi:hypothetical protein
MVAFFEILVDLIEEATALLFMTLYLGCEYSGIKRVGGFIITLCISLGTITILNSVSVYEGFWGLIFTAEYFLYALLFLKENVYIKLFISGFINCIMYFIALLTTILFNMFSNWTNEQIHEMTVGRIEAVVISKVALILVCVILLLLKLKFGNVVRKSQTGLVVIMPIIMQISMVGIMNAFMANEELKNELFLATVSVMFANALTYYVFVKANMDAQLEVEMNAVKQKYESDKKYAHEVEELYSKTCGIKHDLITHFEIISGLLQSDPDEALAYINSVTKNQLNSMKTMIRTGNECFDALANAKLAICEGLDIKVQVRVMNHSMDNLNIDEIGVIIGNLFDNAIEAVKNLKEKRIELDIQKQGKRCSIFMKNTVVKSVLSDNENLETTKVDKANHGFGIKNIQNIVTKHGGMIDFFEENDMFCCDILI